MGALALCFASGVAAQATSGATAPRTPQILAQRDGPAWASLSPSQQVALAPLRRDWDSIDAMRKEKWLQIAARFPAMPPDERQRVQARMTEWARMSPSERQTARIQFKEAKQLSPDDRQARWEAYRSLPEEQRKELAQRSKPPAAASRPPPRPKDAPVMAEKRNVVGNPALQSPTGPRPVTPTLVQGNPGATTRLITKPEAPPRHEQVGLPKIVATPGFVDRSTLLPQRGPQGAAVAPGTAPSRPAR